MTRGLRLETRPGRFRVGATSFVHAASWAPNVERLAPFVDDIELLCFDACALPSPLEVRRLCRLKERFDLTYSLHTPLDVALAASDGTHRKQSLLKIDRTLRRARPVAPEHVVVHVCPTDPGSDREVWLDRAVQALETIVELARPGLVVVETLDRHVEVLDILARRTGAALALDLGHFVRDRLAVVDMVQQWLERTRVLQWHGVSARDHQSLVHFPDDDGRAIARELLSSGYDGIVTLEVFSLPDWESSMERLDIWIQDARRAACGEDEP